MVETTGRSIQLMINIKSRLYQDNDDFLKILDLVARVRPSKYRNAFPSKVDLKEKLASAVVRANTRLWFDDGILVSWAIVDEFNNLLWELDHPYEESIGAEMIEWGVSCVRRMLRSGESSTLDAHCREDYTERLSFLIQHGFQQGEGFNLSMSRELSEPIPEPMLPPGFSIRPIGGVEEAEVVAAAHRAAFGTEYMTTENRLIIMSTSGYDPALDLVVIAPDGSIAGNCICSINEVDKIGYTDPVSTHPRFQHMGLARALLLTGLKILKEHGMISARLGTSGENIAMQKAAQSVGFTVEYRTIWFSKEVH